MRQADNQTFRKSENARARDVDGSETTGVRGEQTVGGMMVTFYNPARVGTETSLPIGR